MDTKLDTECSTLQAGSFSIWLGRLRKALRTGTGMAVPCGTCTACCRSSYFIHIKPDEIETLKRIDRALLFPAPGRAKGTLLLGYDEKGCCPLLINGACSIYKYRPLTCRTYDCRIFSAAGIAAGGEDKQQITQQARRWRFSYPAKRDRYQHEAVRAAASFLQKAAESFPAGFVPGNAGELAVLAVKVFGVFIKYGYDADNLAYPSADHRIVKAVIAALEKFEKSKSAYYGPSGMRSR
ncbi:YkgJ family cysteine cluster protein [candidate division KSB1 bacterium]|nr:YkgJ family cysteine cluster protein [candidate division KSB1 bacterium]